MARWIAKKLYNSDRWVILWPDKGGAHMRRVDHAGMFAEADALRIIELQALAERVARLNRDAGEIGAGMLASLVDEARRLTE